MEECTIDCPYCGEIIDCLIDTSSGEQEYYEDCSVCCCPILFDITFDAFNKPQINVRRDNE